MPISPDISDLSWLHQPNPGEFGLRAMQVGLETGRSFVAARNANREQAREDAMLPLRQKFMDNQVKSMALDIKTKMDMQEDHLLNKQAYVALGEAAKAISQAGAWHLPESEAAIWDIAAKYPSVMETPQFKHIASQFDAAAAAERMRMSAEGRIENYKGTLALRDKEIAHRDMRLQDTLASNEKISAEKNATLLEVQKLRTDLDAKDRLDDMEFQMYQKLSQGLLEEAKLGKMGGAELERKLKEALGRAIESSKERRSKDKTGAAAPKDDGTVIVVSPQGKKGRIPRSQLQDALKQGFKEYEG
jgi:hypothetical protein